MRWLLRFRKLDMRLKDQRQALVDPFINAIYLYDDKVLIASIIKKEHRPSPLEKRQKLHPREVVRIWIAFLHHKKDSF